MVQQSIQTLMDRKDLAKQESYECFKEIMTGQVPEILIASFLTALRMKGETIPEISGAALAMREMATKIHPKSDSIVDTCGTGGDRSGTFNISTASALVASSAGARVAKHGNRAVSSKCGSADILRAFGVNIEVPMDKLERAVDEIGIAFLFAPLHHGAMKYAGPVRSTLKVRTIFNILGPLTNPAGAKRQLLGVFEPSLTEVLAEVLLDLGSEKVMVVHGSGGLDEISTIGSTKVTEIDKGSTRSYELEIGPYGFSQTTIERLRGGDVETNKSIIEHILDGKKSPHRDIVLLNSGAALYVAGIAGSVAEGITRAADAIDNGMAKKKLQQLIDFTN